MLVFLKQTISLLVLRLIHMFSSFHNKVWRWVLRLMVSISSWLLIRLVDPRRSHCYTLRGASKPLEARATYMSKYMSPSFKQTVLGPRGPQRPLVVFFISLPA